MPKKYFKSLDCWLRSLDFFLDFPFGSLLPYFEGKVMNY